jgi:hypothetical protein
MARRYAATGLNACAASPGKTACNTFQTSNTIRPRFFDIIFGSDGTPADNALRFRVSRSTAVGTEGTGVVPVALDSADPAALMDSSEGHSAEPTYTAATEVLDVPLNQRATFRWVCAPDGEVICPATAANGLGVAAIHASYVGNCEAVMHWQE